MARDKRTPIEEKSREGLTDGRFKDPLDVRIQEEKLDKALEKLREAGTPKQRNH